MYHQSVNKVAWKIPNSKLLITINEIKSYNQPSSYNAGIMFDGDNYSICTTTGNDKYSAIENLMNKTNQLADLWWEIIQSIKEDAEIKEAMDWWNFPNNNFDFTKDCFKFFVKFNNQPERCEIKNIFLKSKEKCKYCACLIYEKSNNSIELFRAQPNGDKKIALHNLINAVTGIGALLDKIQNGAWEALIDKDNHEYEITRDRFYNPIINKIGK